MKVLSMIVFDAEPKVPDTEIFPQQTIVDLNSDIKFIVLFCQEKHLRWKEINKQTYIHAQFNLISTSTFAKFWKHFWVS